MPSRRIFLAGWSIAATSLCAGSARAQEVTVRGERRDPGEASIPMSDVREIPGAFGDPFRVVEALPGAVPILSGVPYFFVRGAPPGNVGTFIDGVRVPLLYHVAFGPSVIHPALVDHVDYYPGASPARFGRFVGGVLSARTTPPPDAPHAEGVVRAFDAGALASSPLAGGQGDALVAGRYSYTAAALSAFSPNVSLGYWDYQARAGWKTGERDRVSVFVFGAHDFRNQLPGLSSTFEADFHRVDARFDHTIGRRGNLRLAVTLGTDRSADDQGSATSQSARLRLEIEDELSPEVRLRAGSDVSVDHFDAGVPKNPLLRAAFANVYPEHLDLAAGAYVDAPWRAGRAVELVPGVRADAYDWHELALPATFARSRTNAISAAAIDPRLAARITVHPRVALVAAAGLFHQGPAFLVPVPGVQPAGFARGLQRALQRSAGVEVLLPLELTATSTFFWNDMQNVTDFAGCFLSRGEIDVASGCVERRGAGAAYGWELLVRRPFSRRLSGWISYTLSRANEDVTLGGARASVPTQYDRTHVLGVIGAYDLGRGWRAGARFYLLSGQPYYLQPDGATFTVTPPALAAGSQVERLPAFWRLDLRLEKRWSISTNGWIAFVLEGMNVTLNREAINVICGSPLFGGTCTPVYADTLAIPSVGVEAAF